ncbi:TPA: hypothetical protein DEA21_03525 [Candidatus Uhrbacteria bacterium]|nr:hypothetical protein [Candidatus Uhrbacteria bacterium]
MARHEDSMKEAERLLCSGDATQATYGRIMREDIWQNFVRRGGGILYTATSEKEAREQIVDLLLELGLKTFRKSARSDLSIIWNREEPNRRQAHVSLGWRQASFILPNPPPQ